MRSLFSSLARVSLILMTLGMAAEVSAASLERLVMPGPVSQAHAELEDDCGSCHSTTGDQTQVALCVVCHSEVGADLSAGTGLHGRLPEVADNQCQLCHAEHEGRDAESLEFDWTSFDHNLTDFPLQWAHSLASCETCHAPDLRFSAAPATCVGCHAADDPHEGNLGSQCMDCHTQRTWEKTHFDHAATAFSLSGKHTQLECTACHLGNRFDAAQSDCVSCHQQDDVHNGSLGGDCQQCHNTDGWTGSLFDHATTGFTLTGGHNELACESCHQAGEAKSLSNSTCQSCHDKDDVHGGDNGTACASCHVTSSWIEVRFDHFKSSGFALRGAHEPLKCSACHQGPVSESLPGTCGECHLEDDPHQQQLGSACESCHSDVAWNASLRFDHDLVAFPLLGQHGGLECRACHQSAQFLDAPGSCAECHTEDDVHQGFLGSDCSTCHNPSAWRSTAFDHERSSGFLLAGVHAQLTCISCHGKPAFLQASSSDDCATCHRQDDTHNGRFGTDCARCHGVDSFRTLRSLE